MAIPVKAAMAYAAAMDRLYADARFADGRDNGPELRGLIAAYTTLGLHGHTKGRWEAAVAACATGRFTGVGWWVGSVIRADAPRFEPPRQNRWGCNVPKTRGPNVGKPCGKSGTTFRVTDPATGEWSLATYCRAQHHAEGQAAYAAERALTGVPEPMPNVGGLLPSYLPAGNWPDLYAQARHGWTPPYVGIIADQWPVMAKVATPPVGRPVALTAVDGEGQGGDGPLPPLRLV